MANSEYVTIQGDTWDGISFKLWGTEKYMTKLMELNPEHVRTVIFSAGVRLKVPDISPQTSSELPPWKRVG